MKKVRVAQIGLTLIHAPRFRDSLIYLQDEIDIVGFYDPEAKSDAVRATMKPDVAHVPIYDSIDELLREAKPDVVMISGYPRDMPEWMLQRRKRGSMSGRTNRTPCIPAGCCR